MRQGRFSHSQRPRVSWFGTQSILGTGENVTTAIWFLLLADYSHFRELAYTRKTEAFCSDSSEMVWERWITSSAKPEPWSEKGWSLKQRDQKAVRESPASVTQSKDTGSQKAHLAPKWLTVPVPVLAGQSPSSWVFLIHSHQPFPDQYFFFFFFLPEFPLSSSAHSLVLSIPLLTSPISKA